MSIIKRVNKRNAAFTLNVNGEPRLLFKAREAAADQGLTIIIKHAPYAKLPDAEGNLNSTEISQQYLSIHPSVESKENINVNTMRARIRETGRFIPAMTHFTYAIKQHTNYAPVFTHCCGDLSGNHFTYNVKNDVEIFSLGDYEAALFQPIYMILISDLEAPIIRGDKNINCIHGNFNKFRLTLLWSFLSLPSVGYGRSLLLGTLPPNQLEHDEKLRQNMALLRAGFPPENCLFHFSGMGSLFKQDLIESILSKSPHWPPEEAARYVKIANETGEFFKVGVRNHLPYQQHMSHVEAKLLEDPELRRL